MEDCRVKVVDEWTGFCPVCESSARLVLLERGPRWTLRELFGRTWRPRQDFVVQCRACRASLPIPQDELAAAAKHKSPPAGRPSTPPARSAAAPSPPKRPSKGTVPAQRSERVVPPPRAAAAH